MNNSHLFTCRLKQRGFSLVEMSVVLALIGVLTGGAIVLTNKYLDASAQKITEQRLEFLTQALNNQRAFSDVLPCPADGTLLTTDANFGLSQAPCGTNLTGGGGFARTGVVPVRKLSLPDEYMFDGWGNRITYVMDSRLSTSNFTNYPITDTSTIGDIEVRDANGTPRTTKAIYLLISYGKNGHGAYPHNGGATLVNAGSTNTDELNNCNCNSSGVANSTDNVFVQKQATSDPATPSNNFDDIVVYKMRWQVTKYLE